MGQIAWRGVNEADCIANYKQWFKDADPNAKYYQTADGEWVIEADAVKMNIPGVRDLKTKKVTLI